MGQAAHWAIEPWRHGVTQRALLEIALVGVAGGALGCWVVVHELAYGAESLAHAMFPGLVAAALLGLPLVVGGAAGVAAAGAGIALAGRVPGVGRDAATGVVVTGLFGLGAMLALSRTTPAGLGGLLFGDLLAVTGVDLALAAALAVGTLALLVPMHQRLLAVGFDRRSAASLGARPLLADAALLTLLGAAVTVGVQGLGNLLVVAVVVGPAATALQLRARMAPTMGAAVLVAVACGAAGLYVSYYADLAAGASVAGATVVAYLAALAARAAVRRRPGRPGTRRAAGRRARRSRGRPGPQRP